MNVKKSIASIYAKIREKQLEIEDLLAEVVAIQRRCPHPGEKRIVVTMDDKDDRVSCDDCGKTL